MSTLFRTKSIAASHRGQRSPIASPQENSGPREPGRAWASASVVGSGIFTLTGTAAAGLKFDYPSILKAPVLDLLIGGSHAVGTFGRPGAGPAISISFLLVALACSFAALVLRGTGLHDSGLRQRLHLRLRDHWAKSSPGSSAGI